MRTHTAQMSFSTQTFFDGEKGVDISIHHTEICKQRDNSLCALEKIIGLIVMIFIGTTISRLDDPVSTFSYIAHYKPPHRFDLLYFYCNLICMIISSIIVCCFVYFYLGS